MSSTPSRQFALAPNWAPGPIKGRPHSSPRPNAKSAGSFVLPYSPCRSNLHIVSGQPAGVFQYGVNHERMKTGTVAHWDNFIALQKHEGSFKLSKCHTRDIGTFLHSSLPPE